MTKAEHLMIKIAGPLLNSAIKMFNRRPVGVGSAVGAVTGTAAGAVSNEDPLEGALKGGLVGAGVGAGIGAGAKAFRINALSGKDYSSKVDRAKKVFSAMSNEKNIAASQEKYKNVKNVESLNKNPVVTNQTSAPGAPAEVKVEAVSTSPSRKEIAQEKATSAAAGKGPSGQTIHLNAHNATPEEKLINNPKKAYNRAARENAVRSKKVINPDNATMENLKQPHSNMFGSDLELENSIRSVTNRATERGRNENTIMRYNQRRYMAMSENSERYRGSKAERILADKHIANKKFISSVGNGDAIAAENKVYAAGKTKKDQKAISNLMDEYKSGKRDLFETHQLMEKVQHYKGNDMTRADYVMEKIAVGTSRLLNAVDILASGGGRAGRKYENLEAVMSRIGLKKGSPIEDIIKKVHIPTEQLDENGNKITKTIASLTDAGKKNYLANIAREADNTLTATTAQTKAIQSGTVDINSLQGKLNSSKESVIRNDYLNQITEKQKEITKLKDASNEGNRQLHQISTTFSDDANLQKQIRTILGNKYRASIVATPPKPVYTPSKTDEVLDSVKNHLSDKWPWYVGGTAVGLGGLALYNNKRER